VNAREALGRLKRLGVPVVRTADAAVLLEQSARAASMTLARLAEAGLARRIRHGLFWIDGEMDPYRLPEHLTAPFPSYVSLQTALHLRGLVEQVPAIIYAVSLGRTERVRTSAGSYSIHHVAPEVFGGFEELSSGVKLATGEKALFDLAYLSAGRSRRFAGVPELELPRGFDEREIARWVSRIPSERSRTLTRRRLEGLVTPGSGFRSG
jgi:predicted transcriptional regulator of viral defense system